MIGPAEIEEMMAEYAEAHAVSPSPSHSEQPATIWPVVTVPVTEPVSNPRRPVLDWLSCSVDLG